MKKSLFLCLILTFFKLSVHAQGSFVQPIIWGFKAGINGSFFTKDVNSFDPSSGLRDPSFQRFFRASAFAGMTVDYMLNERVSVGAEVLYSSRGMSYRQKNNGVLVIGNNGAENAFNYFVYKIDYVELPLTVNYNVLSPSSDTWLTGYAGLAPAIAVSKKVTLDHPEPNAGPWKGEPDESAELTGVKSFNTSLLAGIQCGGVPAFLGVYADLRASYTLLPVFNPDQNAGGENLNTRMCTLTFGVGIKF